jgi:hypothetical protein
MSELSKQALKVENNTSFPNNNNGEISAADLRGFNVNMIDSLVDEIGYNVDSASWNQQIDALEQFTSSQQPSFAALNQFTASQLTINSGVNTFTQSANGRLNNLEAYTASFTTSVGIYDEGTFVNNVNQIDFNGNGITASFVSGKASVTVDFSKLNSATASLQAQLATIGGQSGSWITESETGSFVSSAITASSLITASFNNGTRNLTFTKGDNTTFNVNIPDVSGSAGDFVTTSSFNAYTASTNQRVSSLESNSASVNTSITNINTTTASLLIETSNLETFSASALVSISNLNQSSASQQVSIDALNVFTASQSTASIVTSIDNLNSFTQSANIRLNNLESTSASVNTSISNLNSFSASTLVSINALNSATASYVTETESGSFLITASFDNGTRNLTFTKGDTTTFAVNIPDVSGSTINTGSFATTGSNSFIGNQNVAGRVIISGSSVLTNNNYLLFTRDGGNDIFRVGVSDNGQSYDFVVTGSTNQQLWLIDNQGGTYINTFQAPIIATNNVRLESGFTASLQEGYAWVGNSAGKNAQVATSSFAGGTVPAGTISGSQQITDLGFVSSSVTASSLITASVSLNTITFTKGDSTTFNITVDTGSGGGGGGQTFANPSIESISGSVLITANGFTSGAANLTHISASAQNQTNLLFKNTNTAGSTIISGSFNLYTNPAAPAAGRLNYLENSNIFLNDSGFLPTVTASVLAAGGFYPRLRNNLWLGTGPWTINTNRFATSSTIAGTLANNLFLGATGTTINTLGNTVGTAFSHNIMANAGATINAPSRSIAEVNAGQSGSNTINFLGNASFGGTTTYNGPVSSSSHQITGNNTQGTLTLNLQSGSRGYTVSQNITNGTLTINDNTVFAPTLGSSNTFQQNNINGTVTATNRGSASFSIAGNTFNGFTITNDYDSSTNGAANRLFALQGNSIFGFIANNIYLSGSANGAGTASDRGRGLYGNLIGGNRISASVIGDGNRHLIASAIVGHGLNVYGTALYDGSNAGLFGGQNGGSAFFGRWNAEDGNRALSAQTVFAVGTGTSGSAGLVRKTGFLIDSGSNTFIEGTLNVSGSTILSGSTFINNLQNGITSNIVTYDTTTGELRKATAADILSASFDAAEFWSTVTQSGSAGVSGSVTFNNSGSVSGISVVNNTQVTLSQAGTYNIQFSAQLETSAGADTVYLWFKKNGTNITDSASKAVLANNTAQIMTVNILDAGVANDYYELAYQTTNGHATVLYEPASGNIPAIPSVILTIQQIR